MLARSVNRRPQISMVIAQNLRRFLTNDQKWCGRSDSNRRTPTGRDLKSRAFGPAQPLPHGLPSLDRLSCTDKSFGAGGFLAPYHKAARTSLRSGLPISSSSYLVLMIGLSTFKILFKSIGVPETTMSQSLALIVSSRSFICVFP